MNQHLSLLREFVRRDFQGRYAGSALGLLWSLIQPAWQLVLFTAVFGYVMTVPLEGELTESFPIFLFCGLMPWLAVQEGIQRATTAITDNANLVKKVHFPSEILVATVVLSAIIHQAIASAVFVAVLLVTGRFDPSGLWVLLFALPLQVALTTGLALLAAATNIYLRDVSQLQGMLLMGWFYATPIVYSLAMAKDLEKYLLYNPMTALVDLYRQAFLGGDLLSARGLTSLMVCSVVFLVLGIALFRVLKPTFADEL